MSDLLQGSARTGAGHAAPGPLIVHLFPSPKRRKPRPLPPKRWGRGREAENRLDRGARRPMAVLRSRGGRPEEQTLDADRAATTGPRCSFDALGPGAGAV